MSLHDDKADYLERKLRNQPDASDEEVKYWSDKWDKDSPKSSMSKRSACFVASTVYGDSSHPHVTILRRFRDEKLSTKCSGRLCIRVYELLGPAMAVCVRRTPFLTTFVRFCLDRLVSLLKDGALHAVRRDALPAMQGAPQEGRL